MGRCNRPIGRPDPRDGIGGNSFARSIATISREALVTGHERPRPASSLLRWRVLSLIPPARSMELHRFVGEVLGAQIDDKRAVPLATELGTYLLAGGLDEQARPLIAAGVDALLRAGYERAAAYGDSSQRAVVAKNSLGGPTKAKSVETSSKYPVVGTV